MSGTLRIDSPQPEWLTFERACFGFEAQAGSGRFSFSDTFTMINLRATQFSKDSAGLRILVSPSLCNLVLVDVVSGEYKLLRSLDEILDFDEYGGDKYNSAVTMFDGLGIPKDLLTSFTMSRDMLVNAVRTSLNEDFARIHARVGSPLATVFTEIPADSFRAFKIEHFHSGRASAVDGSRLFSIHVAPEGGLSAAPGRSAELPAKQASLARFIIEKHGGRWPESQWKSLLADFSEWTNVQTGSRTTIGRSSAADLKRRFPEGFPFQHRPLNKIGR